MMPDPNGNKAAPRCGPRYVTHAARPRALTVVAWLTLPTGPLTSRVRHRLAGLVEFLNKINSEGDGRAVKTIRALRRLVADWGLLGL